MKARLLILIIVLVMIFTGCSANVPHKGNDNVAGDGFDDAEYSDNSTAGAQIEIRKIIKNGDLNLETEDVEKTYGNILSYAIENGGYEFSHKRYVRDEFVSIQAVIKISPEKLDNLMSYSGNVAVIINSSTSSDDITEKYYDAKLRLDTKRKMLGTYYDLLENAKGIDEILMLQNEINALTEDIEVYEGKIKLWDSLVNESTLNITISQINDPLKPTKQIDWKALSWKDMGLLIKNGFVSVSNFIIAIFQWLIIAIVSLLPLIVILGILVLVILLIQKNKQKKKEQKLNQIKKDNGDKNE